MPLISRLVVGNFNGGTITAPLEIVAPRDTPALILTAAIGQTEPMLYGQDASQNALFGCGPRELAIWHAVTGDPHITLTSGPGTRLKTENVAGSTQVEILATGALGMFGGAPAVQAATPVTLGDVIAILRAFGFAA